MNYKVEAEQINWADTDNLSYQRPMINREVQISHPSTLVTWLTYASLLVFPLTFGGVHAKANLSFSFLLLALTISIFLSSKSKVTVQRALGGQYSNTFLMLVVIYAAFSCIQNMLLGFFTIQHPVLGQISLNNNWLNLALQLQPIIVFGSAVMLWFSLFASGKSVESVWKFILVCGALVATVALSHWYYDNGRLFWLFEPQNIFISERARWPFVNPNHLAAYLVPLVFLAWAQISLKAREVAEKISSIHGQGIGLLFLSNRIQKGFLSLSLAFALFLIIGLALIGALSRSSWIGISAGLLFFMYARSLITSQVRANYSKSKVHSNSNVHWLNKLKTRRSKRRSRHKSFFSKFLDFFIQHSEKVYKGLVAVALGAVLYFFLNQQGGELLAGRVEYALTSSLDDARWVIFGDSFRILKEHMFLGIGLGSWSQLYPSYASPSIAGIDPVYLHSDPYQLLIESGVFGFSLFAAFALLIFRANLSQIASGGLSVDNRLRLLGLSSGIFALLVTSFFDFPLRIPAIFLLLAALLALNLYLLDESKAAQ